MKDNYFSILKNETKTRFWINNPSEREIKLALEQGAVNCTTNPAFCSKLISSEPEYLQQVIDDVIKEYPDIEEAAKVVYQRASKRIMEFFCPIYEESKGTEGFVTMQDDPRKDEDTESIINAALENRKLGKNFMVKIPVIKGGIEAIEGCVEENIPICATEVFSISQAVYMCEKYTEAVKRTGNSPRFFITHISGIFDEYLKKYALRENIKIDSGLIDSAGLSVARKEYAILKKMGYKTTLLGGGARGPHHFTGLAGGSVHITINWSTAEEIINSGVTVENTLDTEISSTIIDELKEKFEDYRKAYDEDGLQVDEFAGFGPVQLFRNSFLKGWYLLLAEIASRKHAAAL